MTILLKFNAVGEVERWPYHLGDLMVDHPNTSFSVPLQTADLAPFGVAVVEPKDPPAASMYQRVIEVVPTLADGVWRQTWSVVDMDAAEREAVAALQDQRRIAALWQAAHDYEVAQISGSAIGLLTLGVLQSKPKCQAVQAWIKTIWTMYYERKASGSTDVNFSAAGPIPHTIPELMDELLRQEQLAAREAAKQQRAAAVAAITVTTAAGRTFNGDEAAQARMARTILALGTLPASSTTTWVLANNTPAQVTATELTEALALAGAAQTALWVLE
jgi:hypothetical protein